ncbi:MAG TPA: DUF885 domain-containing protein [Acidimicrobiales bacterium]|nr:DUF885 domain-containing protein [Acidimicrobiales bacterium]
MTEGGAGAADPEAQALIDAWLGEEIEESPTRASALGIEGHDEELGEFGEAAFVRRAASARHWAETLRGVDGRALSRERAVDRDLVLSALAGRVAMEDWEAWRRDPAVYLDPCLGGVHVLFVHRLRPMAERAAAAASRLGQVPAALDAARRQLDPTLVNDVIRDRAVGQCAAAGVYVRDLLPGEIPPGPDRDAVADVGAVAAAAFEGLAAHLTDMRPTGTYAIGEQRYSALLRDRELLGYGAAGLRDRGRAAWDELDGRMTEVARRLGHDRWRDALDAVQDRHPATPEEMLRGYTAMTERCRAFLVERDLVTIPEGESVSVEPSPPYQRPVLAVASYLAPPPFRPGRLGHFFVPFPPDGVGAEQLRQRLATNSYAAMATISAHEAYPGHHWHLVWSQENAPPVRSVVRTPYFSEGWALFAEQIMAEAGFFADDAEMLSYLDARIFRAARIVVDTGLHCGDMTVEEAVTHLVGHTGLSEATARAEVTRYCAWPTQSASYLTGALELDRMRTRYVGEGRGDGRRFNDEVAATGSLPLGLAERCLLPAAAA